ncbi:MAG: division/cell wall cluster transcriptional repressor MraZ [Candidatus Omnitrophota bacterium]
MFYGEYEHTIDNKGRVIIPSRFRDVFKEFGVEKFYVTRGLDKCLFLFTREEWISQEQKFKAMSFTKAEARKFNRLYFSGATELACDNQGRILLPQYLKDYAAIKRDVMIVGVSNRIEIWSKDEWRRYYSEAMPLFEKTAENLLDLDKKE